MIVVVFLIKAKYVLNILNAYPKYFSYLLFLAVPIALTALSFLLAMSLPKDSLSNTSVKEIELANSSFLPTYLGYFFVSLSVPDASTLVFVFGIIYTFTFLSQALYFNPILLLFGYHFYFIKTSGDVKIFLITRKKLKVPGDDSFGKLRRINNYTFIDI
jgi:hypothetical protein